MQPYIVNCLIYFDKMSKNSLPKTRCMEEKSTQGIFWSILVEEDINTPIIHNKNCKFYTQKSLIKVVTKS